MSRYIDADALIDRLDYCVKEGMGSTIAFTFMNMVEDAPTIDAVSVVRCKDCKHYKQSEGFCENGNGLWQAGDECFCSYGERKEDE